MSATAPLTPKATRMLVITDLVSSAASSEKPLSAEPDDMDI